MLKLSHRTLILISGFVWMAVGCFLLPLGLNLILGKNSTTHIFIPEKYPLINSISPYLGGFETTALLLITVSLFIGFMKGRFVLGKAVKRGVDRIRQFPNPTSLANIYSGKYYILLGSMVALGISIKYLGIPNDVRGIIDVAVGAALINGAMLYFRSAFSEGKVQTN